jgi:hypothetical protein
MVYLGVWVLSVTAGSLGSCVGSDDRREIGAGWRQNGMAEGKDCRELVFEAEKREERRPRSVPLPPHR